MLMYSTFKLAEVLRQSCGLPITPSYRIGEGQDSSKGKSSHNFISRECRNKEEESQ
jgi:hypothetical protein